MASGVIDQNLIADNNRKREKALTADYEVLGEQLARRGIDIERITKAVAAFAVAIPSWGVGTGGTRFARFPGPGEPRDIFDKLDDCAVINQLEPGDADGVAAHPVGQGEDLEGLRQKAEKLGLELRRDELQHLPGFARPEAQLQVRQPFAYREGGARSGDRPQHRMHRDRPEDRLEGADGVDRRRLELPRPGELHRAPSSATSIR